MAALFAALALFYSLETPIFEAPDELWHYEVVAEVARGSFADPTGPARQEATQPPLYYALGALLWQLAPAGPPETELQFNPHFDYNVAGTGNKNLIYHGEPGEEFPFHGIARTVHLIRLLSVALGTLTILGVLDLSRSVVPERPRLGLLAAGFCAFNPEFLFLSGAITNDLAIVATSTWTLACLARWLAGPAPGQDERGLLAGLTLGLGLALLSKATAFGLALVVGWALLRAGSATDPRRLGRAAIVLGGSFLLSVWWYLRLWLLYRDPLGTTVRDVALGRTAPFSLQEAGGDLAELAVTFVARFGWTNVAPPAWVWLPLVALGLAGLGLGLRSSGVRRRPAFLAQVGWIGVILGLFFVWQLPVPGAQGRLIFPAIGSLGVVWAIGWDGLLDRLGTVSRRAASLGLGAGALALAVAVPLVVIRPAYVPQPTRLLSALPRSAQIAAASFGEEVALIGYDLSETSVRPGDLIAARLYWRKGPHPSQNLSLDLRLVERDGHAVASTDLALAPDLPLSSWPNDRVVEIRVSVPVPTDSVGPRLLRLDLGVYSLGAGHIQHLALAGQATETLPLATIRLDAATPSASGPAPAVVSFASPGGDSISLLGWFLLPVEVGPRRVVRGLLLWRADAPPRIDYTVFVHLVRAGKVIAQHDAPPLSGAYPTTAWLPGQVVRDQFELALPDDVAPGSARLEVGLYNLTTLARLTFPGGDAWELTTLDLPDARVSAVQGSGGG